LPIADQFSFVGKLGVSANRRTLHDPIFELSERKTGRYTSIGVQYLLNEKVSFNLDYEQYGKRGSVGLKANAFSLNVKYAF
jgi:OOP family OmpA-OmpF porin